MGGKRNADREAALLAERIRRDKRNDKAAAEIWGWARDNRDSLDSERHVATIRKAIDRAAMDSALRVAELAGLLAESRRLNTVFRRRIKDLEKIET